MTGGAEALLADLQDAPASAKVRACLQLQGVRFRRTPATLALMRRVRRRAPGAMPPILEIAGETVVGAAPIVAWIESVAPDPPLVPEARSARGYCRMVERWADDTLGVAVAGVLWSDPTQADVTARALATDLVPGPLVPAAARWLRRRARRRHPGSRTRAVGRLADAIEVLDAALETRTCLLGEALTIADVAVYVHLARLDPLRGREALPPLGRATRAWRARLDAVEALRTAIAP